MQGKIPVERQRILIKIAKQAERIKKRSASLASNKFVIEYFHGVAEDDLRSRAARDLASGALAHLHFGRQRRRQQPIVRVYTPTVKADGWTTSHSVVDVVTDDMPFLVDSLASVFAKQGLAVHLTVHPVLKVKRDAHGSIVALSTSSDEKTTEKTIDESWQHIEIDQLADAASLEQLRDKLLSTLDDVRRACTDWRAMHDRARLLAAELKSNPRSDAEVKEAGALIEWLADNHFTFLGYREYTLKRSNEADILEPLPTTSLGLLRTKRRPQAVELTGALRAQARSVEPVFISKSNSLSTVHRSVYLDHLGIKRFDKTGRVVGEHRFLGLFTSNVYQLSPRDIPLIRRKVTQLIENLGLVANSHDGKAVMHVLDTYPRDELFQADVNDLIEAVRGVVNLYDRQQVRLFVRRDRFQRFYSCLLYVPRDRYSTQVRERIETLMLDAMNGTGIESQVQLSDSALARVHMLVRCRVEDQHRLDVVALEKTIRDTVQTWQDHLRSALIARHGESRGLALARSWVATFPAAYQDDVSIAVALDDIEHLEALQTASDGQQLRLLKHNDTEELIRESTLRLRLLRTGVPISLSDALPVLEHLGLRALTERPYRIVLAGQRSIWIQDFELSPRIADATINIADVATRFRDAYLAIDSGRAESDDFNCLVLDAGLNWREVSVLRAYARYLLQTGLPFSQSYMERTLVQHASVAAALWQLFAQQFDPLLSKSRELQSKVIREKLLRALDQVAAQDEDRILRAYLAAIDATLRTNYYQRDALREVRPYISFKLDSRRLPDLPLPKPLVEIFVYSPRVEGIHLRMGKVARGGIRWSDRREDFRTEVLGLMKAQNVKNTVIVPVGAKGGFVPKCMPSGATVEDRQREGVACYRTFIRGLLDLTDNIRGNRIEPPIDVVRRDADDPYLVVAADKGTATFSDIANGISLEYDFWLGDAFASGGSAGYDHKKMAITARGAWECVKRHFRELGVDTQTQDFTVVGIGDMAGDVFGNGLLRSKYIRLQAAFNHQHIFLDPEPDAATSFAERERLFNLPRSTWEDYNSKLISKGGGIFSRAAKSIALSPPVKTLLGVSDASMSPQALIKAILRMPVDLLWNGGIGTYVKAGSETHAEVGDRSNDGVRINGEELRC
ncbi:MAG: NAD-glutamate dehydrogenase, partial [Candidatus Obscuribacterales bacterium]|nr:NAD-glutamate dehydrogenase [Steroidobacteraceae bacterium]